MGKAKGKRRSAREWEAEADAEVPCTLRFCNQRQGVTARVLWVDDAGEEKEYARLDELCFYNQETYVNHPWRLRNAASGALLAEYVGPTATITLLPDGGTHAEPGLHRPPAAEVSDPRWGTYRQRGTALGIPIFAFDCVDQQAVQQAEHIVHSMLQGAEQATVATMVQGGAEVAVIGRHQATTDLPMYRHLRGMDCENGGGDYDEATRGLGGNPGNPTTSCGEENLLMDGDERYGQESILVHEFGHAVMDLGLHQKPLRNAIVEAYRAARKRRGVHAYDLDCYMMANECEYWAEGTQAWFDATVREDVTSGVNTREKLKERDPRLAGLLSKVYGDGPWRYPATAPGKFEPWACRSSDGSGGEAAASGAGSGKRQRSSRGSSKQAPVAAAPATTQQHEQESQQQQPRQVPVLVEHQSITEPLLHGGGGSGLGGVSRRRRAGSPSRRGGGGAGGSLGVVPRRITRAFARLTGCCFGSL